MNFKPMDPDVVWQLLEGSTDMLKSIVDEEENLYKNATCPICQEQGCMKKPIAPPSVPGPNGEPVFVSSPFGDNGLVKGRAVCMTCGTEFDPRTGVIVEAAPFMIDEPHSDPHQL